MGFALARVEGPFGPDRLARSLLVLLAVVLAVRTLSILL